MSPNMLLLNETWVHSPARIKANLLTPGHGEGKCSIYGRSTSKESRYLGLKRPQLPNGFEGKVFKDGVRLLVGMYTGAATMENTVDGDSSKH